MQIFTLILNKMKRNNVRTEKEGQTESRRNRVGTKEFPKI